MTLYPVQFLPSVPIPPLKTTHHPFSKKIKGTFYDLFPKSIGELFIRFPLWEFELTLTKGRWFYHRWGSSIPNIAPYGAQLKATFFERDNSHSQPPNSKGKSYQNLYPPKSTESDWIAFQQILSGLYCGSINEIGIQTTHTHHIFPPRGSVSVWGTPPFFLRRLFSREPATLKTQRNHG